mmetsp:Transcript_27306/g.89148  ORF Transcript_27306/g.89148 Transcript_27306/m.89148 type:complete len:146 (-) Transcript_27306:628-1065(-)
MTKSALRVLWTDCLRRLAGVMVGIDGSGRIAAAELEAVSCLGKEEAACGAALEESVTSAAAGAAGAGNEFLNIAKISLPGELGTGVSTSGGPLVGGSGSLSLPALIIFMISAPASSLAGMAKGVSRGRATDGFSGGSAPALASLC